MGRVARDFPAVDINLRRGSTADTLTWLKKGDVEFAGANDLEDRWARIDRWQLASERLHEIVEQHARTDRRLGDKITLTSGFAKHSKRRRSAA